MEYILDTHTFLWFINGDKQLSEKAKKSIEDTSATKYISIATLWEIAIKVSIGKLELDMPFEELKQHVLLNGFELLLVMFEHTLELTSLEFHHRDPFDRIIIAQGFTENYTIITKDKNFKQYKKLKLLW